MASIAYLSDTPALTAWTRPGHSWQQSLWQIHGIRNCLSGDCAIFFQWMLPKKWMYQTLKIAMFKVVPDNSTQKLCSKLFQHFNHLITLSSSRWSWANTTCHVGTTLNISKSTFFAEQKINNSYQPSPNYSPVHSALNRFPLHPRLGRQTTTAKRAEGWETRSKNLVGVLIAPAQQ